MFYSTLKLLDKNFSNKKNPKYKVAPPLKQQFLALYNFKTQKYKSRIISICLWTIVYSVLAIKIIKYMSYPYRIGYEPLR